MAIVQLIIAGVSAIVWGYIVKGGVLGWLGALPVGILVAKLSEKLGVDPFRLHKRDDDDPFYPIKKYSKELTKDDK